MQLGDSVGKQENRDSKVGALKRSSAQRQFWKPSQIVYRKRCGVSLTQTFEVRLDDYNFTPLFLVDTRCKNGGIFNPRRVHQKSLHMLITPVQVSGRGVTAADSVI
eukprot:3804308-Amphidinium_carterae.1